MCVCEGVCMGGAHECVYISTIYINVVANEMERPLCKAVCNILCHITSGFVL